MIPLNGFYELISSSNSLSGDVVIPTGTTAITISSGNNASHAHIKLGKIPPGGGAVVYVEISIIAGIPYNIPKTTTHLTTNSISSGAATFVTFLQYNKL